MSREQEWTVLIHAIAVKDSTLYPSKNPGQKLDSIKNQVVIDRNQIGRKIMKENSIPVIDLYGLMEPDLENTAVQKEMFTTTTKVITDLRNGLAMKF